MFVVNMLGMECACICGCFVVITTQNESPSRNLKHCHHLTLCTRTFGSGAIKTLPFFFFFLRLFNHSCFKAVKAEAVKKTKVPTKVEKAVTVANPPRNVAPVKPEPVPQVQVWWINVPSGRKNCLPPPKPSGESYYSRFFLNQHLPLRWRPRDVSQQTSVKHFQMSFLTLLSGMWMLTTMTTLCSAVNM